MKIAVDEHIPLMSVQALRAMEHDVLDIRGTPDEGMPDDDLWMLVQNEGRLLITTDKGFAQRRATPHYGLLIVRLRQPNRHKIHHRIMEAMAQISAAEWPGLLVVMRDRVLSTWHAKE